MTSSAIFEATGFMRSVWAEIYNLADAAAIALQKAGLKAVFKENKYHSVHDEQRMAFQYAVAGVYKHQKSPAQISLFFDLWRPPQASTWLHGNKALLIVAYSSRYSDGWDCDLLASQGNGQFEHRDTRESTTAFLGNRLWAWGVDERPAHWARAEWFFAVELEALTDPEALCRLVIDPIVALLKGNDEATALQKIESVSWPIQDPD